MKDQILNQMKSAWVITWEWANDSASKEKKVAAILNYRRSPEQVKMIVEALYNSSEYALSDQFSIAKDRKSNPYPATYGDKNGIPFQAYMSCGHNPFLLARLVKDIKLMIDCNGDEYLMVKNKKII